MLDISIGKTCNHDSLSDEDRLKEGIQCPDCKMFLNIKDFDLPLYANTNRESFIIDKKR